MISEIRRPMLQWPQEIFPFLEWVESQDPRIILEIGTGPGGLTEAFLQIAPRVISIDLPLGSSTGMSYDLCRSRNSGLDDQFPGFTGVLGNSHSSEVQALVSEILGPDRVDLLFIDGDHYYNGVRSDFEAYGPFVRPGGWIAFHDINARTQGVEVEVHRLWDELVGTKKIWSADGSWGGIGALEVQP